MFKPVMLLLLLFTRPAPSLYAPYEIEGKYVDNQGILFDLERVGDVIYFGGSYFYGHGTVTPSGEVYLQMYNPNSADTYCSARMKHNGKDLVGAWTMNRLSQAYKLTRR